MTKEEAFPASSFLCVSKVLDLERMPVLTIPDE
jgi:hypothetical protein